MARLDEVADLIMGQSPPSSAYNKDGRGLPFFQGKVDFGFRHPTPRIYCDQPTKIAQKNDILMSVRAPVGPMNIADQTCCIGRGLAAIRGKEIVSEFLYYNLNYIQDYIASLGTGSTFKAINKNQLASIEVNLHDFDTTEQERIAHILCIVQNAIAQQNDLVSLTRELKRTILHKLFTEGLRGEKKKKTEIGLMPESWDVLPLDKLLSQTQYGLSVRGEVSGDYGILRMTNQIEGKISTEKMQFVNISKRDFENYRLKHGDILFNRTNSMELVGRTAIFDIEGDFVFASYLIRVKTDAERYNPFFLNHYLNWDETQRRLKSIALRAVSQSNISATRLRTFQVPVPSLEEQSEIISMIDTVIEKTKNHHRKKYLFEELFRTLLHQLMTAQIRVNNIELDDIS